jgi:hypothetical protein
MTVAICASATVPPVTAPASATSDVTLAVMLVVLKPAMTAGRSAKSVRWVHRQLTGPPPSAATV